MVYRVYVEKKPALASEAASLFHEATTILGIKGLTSIRVINRYDVENIKEELFEYATDTVFSEPQLDLTYRTLPAEEGDIVFAVEYLPGQFDQRADSAAQCIQIISQGERPLVRTAKVYIVRGDISGEDLAKLKAYLINPVECREASLDLPATLVDEYTTPDDVAILDGFREISDADAGKYVAQYNLAMDADDLIFTRDYFRKEGRDPTLTELRLLDTYWSDHCRHTTFLTTLDEIGFGDEDLRHAFERYLDLRRALGRADRPINMMDIATIGARYLKSKGKLPRLDESDEINACTVKIKVNGEDWLLLFKNETHNHPTEIEPFGGAATCIGGAIRDPLSGRAYVYAAMRVTGAADPTVPISETLPGKLPQRKIVTTAAAGYSSYGNQIGLATGCIDEIYHPGYAAKRMEIGAVLGAVPADNVRRERPVPGDVVILLGGRTGRDGCGGATGSSKAHTEESLATCGAEVQKGNAPEERKLQRLFRNKEAARLIKKCNDFGAGGVSVAVGELADGLDINLDAVPKKYEGLDGTELAISESQERMAVVVTAEDVERFRELAAKENLEATVIATVTDDNRIRMKWRGRYIVDISREFLSSNGAEKHACAYVTPPKPFKDGAAPTSAVAAAACGNYEEAFMLLAGDLNVCSKRGLSERFDSTIGAGAVLFPFGGRNMVTPPQAMVYKLPVLDGDTDDCSLMAWGYNPFITERSPYHGAYLAVVESVTKLIATGAPFRDIYLSFQEYFGKPGTVPERWGVPVAALLGALDAQLALGIASIGGKDSMSGTFGELDVPPTLVSFAVTTAKIKDIISPEFKSAGNSVYIFKPELLPNGSLPDGKSITSLYERFIKLSQSGAVLSAFTPTYGGVSAGVMRSCFGNGIGFKYADYIETDDLFGCKYGSIVAEITQGREHDALAAGGVFIGQTKEEPDITYRGVSVPLAKLESEYNKRLESVFPCDISKTSSEKNKKADEIPAFTYKAEQRVSPAIVSLRPRVLIPVFPGTNCEYDTAKALTAAGAEPHIFVIKNMTPQDIAQSAEEFARLAVQSEIIFIPGGFSGGDEPDGSGKFITAFFRNGMIAEKVNELLSVRRGLMCGICNGFQALIKLGLVPYGEIREPKADSPTLTYNEIGRHQSRIVYTRIASNMSPWLLKTNPGDVYAVPISHGEGRFIASDEIIEELAANGQIATQYCDETGRPSYDIRYNPNGSRYAIEGITSPDGRVLGRMGHVERNGAGLYKNVQNGIPFDTYMFESAVMYFR